MSRDRGFRVLKAGEFTYFWRVRHRHDEGCDEILSLRRAASPSGRLLHFRPRPGFVIPDGGVSAAGVVGDDAGRWLNLNEPGVVRALVDVLTAAQWPAADRGFLDLDGWDWFGSAHRHRTAAGQNVSDDEHVRHGGRLQAGAERAE